MLTGIQQALSLVRGPFLDGFWLGEDAPYDAWVQQQQHQWQVRLQGLFGHLSSWQEESGEQEQAKAILVRWLALDPLSEEAYRRLMRVHLALEIRRPPVRSMPPAGRAWPRRCRSNHRRTRWPWPHTFAPGGSRGITPPLPGHKTGRLASW